jgi:hypothetical protein
MSWNRMAPLVCLGVAALLPSDTQAAARPEASVWRTDYTAAREEARRARKLLFVVFRCQP